MRWISPILLLATATCAQVGPIFPGPGAAAVSSGFNGFAHKRTITWDATQAGTADSATFTGLINATVTDWKTVANGGSVQNTVSQSGSSYNSTIPADLVFTSDSGCASPVSGWEWESYNSSSGASIVWVNIGTLSHTSNTVIYACYGKSSVTTQQAAVANTWDSGYKAVYHFGGSANLSDSTGGTALTCSGSASAAGPVGNALNLTVSTVTHNCTRSAFSLGANVVTMEAWINGSGNGAVLTTANVSFIEKSPVNAAWHLFGNVPNLLLRGGNSNNDLSDGALSNGTWLSVGGSITGTSGVAYLNGTATTGTVDAFTDASSQLNIGSYDNASGFNFGGLMDEIRISNTVRATSYFTSRFNQEKSGQTMVTIGVQQ